MSRTLAETDPSWEQAQRARPSSPRPPCGSRRAAGWADAPCGLPPSRVSPGGAGPALPTAAPRPPGSPRSLTRRGAKPAGLRRAALPPRPAASQGAGPGPGGAGPGPGGAEPGPGGRSGNAWSVGRRRPRGHPRATACARGQPRPPGPAGVPEGRAAGRKEGPCPPGGARGGGPEPRARPHPEAGSACCAFCISGPFPPPASSDLEVLALGPPTLGLVRRGLASAAGRGGAALLCTSGSSR